MLSPLEIFFPPFFKDYSRKYWTNGPCAGSFGNCSLSILLSCALPSQVMICSPGCPLRPGEMAIQNVLLILLLPPENPDLKSLWKENKAQDITFEYRCPHHETCPTCNTMEYWHQVWMCASVTTILPYEVQIPCNIRVMKSHRKT